MDDAVRLGVLTSGGDAQGMNAAVRAVVRAGINRGVEVYAIAEGYKGMLEGGGSIHPMAWNSVAGILQLGGTVIGTARCEEFRQRDGRRRAVHNLLVNGIDRLVVIGGDGSLTGASVLYEEWTELVAELVADGAIDEATAARHPRLHVVGLVGSIDNDMVGTDMTIGADTALHRITAALDAISSTAASHQRTFVVEVMGRKCGYLALRGAIAGGADWLFIPEDPPEAGWEDQMCAALRDGRVHGRRDSIVLVAEGAADRDGNRITSDYIRRVLEERLGEDTRVTVLGHVQRGGSPSAFDRYMGTVLGYAAVEELVEAAADREPQLIGLRNNRITRTPLTQSVDDTRNANEALRAGEYERVCGMRSGSFLESLNTLHTLIKIPVSEPALDVNGKRLAILHGGGLAPGMNTAARVAVRLALEYGHRSLGVRNGFQGLVEGQVEELDWMSVSGWAIRGGAELGVTRRELNGKDLYAIAKTIEAHDIDGILMIGGWSGYRSMHRIFSERANFPAFNIPLVCLPVTINNNLPGSEVSIGADTALNSIVGAVDKIKQSAVAAGRCFVVEVMGRYCGYLALMSGLATGAERVFLHEEGVTLKSLEEELANMIAGFKKGKRLSLIVRNEHANPVYTTGFMSALFAEEGRDLYSVRQAILGHLQQGGDPSPYDRILATRLAARCLDYMSEETGKAQPGAAFIGVRNGRVQFTDFENFHGLVDETHERPRDQWWMELRDVARALGRAEDLT
jgi:6-phosphofructokinase 1